MRVLKKKCVYILIVMDDIQLTRHNLSEFMDQVQTLLLSDPILIVSIKKAGIGNWGMARLWRAWMATTAENMAGKGITMPLMIGADGKYFGTRPFNAEDAHQLFTIKWLGVDDKGDRVSWSKAGRAGMRAATKAERFHSLERHSQWCAEKGIILFNPRDSEFEGLTREQNG